MYLAKNKYLSHVFVSCDDKISGKRVGILNFFNIEYNKQLDYKNVTLGVGCINHGRVGQLNL